MKKHTAQNGQVLLIVLLVMVVGLTMGLSVASRSTTDVKISNQLEQSSQAFSAAEAGIESALKGDIAISTCGSSPAGGLGSASYSVCVDPANATSGLFRLNNISKADTFTLWLTSHDSSGNLQLGPSFDYSGSSLDLCWNGNAALETTIVYYDGSNYKVKKGTYDPTGNTGNTSLEAHCRGCSCPDHGPQLRN